MAIDKNAYTKKTVVISKENIAKGLELAKADNKNFSNFINVLIAKTYRDINNNKNK